MLYYNQSVIGCHFSHPRIVAFLNTWCVCMSLLKPLVVVS